MSARLVLEIPGRAPVELPASGKLVLGSHPERADVVLDGQGVDPVHCTIGRLKGGGWALKDLGSEYGTILNGKRVESARLGAGDQLLLGSTRLQVVDPANPGAAPSQPERPAAVVEELPAEPEPPAAVIEELDAEPAPRPQPSKPRPKPQPKSKARPASSQPGQAAASGTPNIPGYDLERGIGKGGTGEVWLATQRSLDRRVALKMLSARLEADPTFVERFQAEARAAAALNHPNVVTVHDVGEADGRHYLTMEYMAAGCLEARLGALGPMPWRDALKVLLDAARGLEYAESRGVVHRDIKPANLMQTEDGITKICDLGLAVQVEQEEVTAGGQKVFGTPHFLPPELLRGERADSRSDLYSLGATAYRVLSGHTPFEGDSTKEILRGVLQDEPEPLVDMVPGLPLGVSELVMRLLEKEPTRRTPSASVLVRELERLIAEDGASRTPQAAPRAKGNQTKLIVGIVAAGLLAVVGKSLLGGGGTAPKDPEPVVQPQPEEGPDGGPGASPAGDTGSGEEDGGVAQGESGAEDGDEAAKIVEQEARIALLTLNSTQLTEDERVVALTALAEKYLGTDAAEEARTEADALTAALTAQASEEAQLARQRTALLVQLREAAGLDADPPRPGDGLRALRAVPGQEVWLTDGEFVVARAQLRDEVLTGALTWARDAWARAGQHEEAGEFTSMVELCRQIIALTDLPDFTEEPPAVVELRALAAEARLKRDGAASLEAAFAVERAQSDSAKVAAAFGGLSGLQTELASCDLAAAEERLLGVQARLVTEEARERVTPWLAEVRSAQQAFEVLASTWKAKSWKRRSVMEPGGDTRDVVGVSREGLMLEAPGGSDLLPWSAFGGHLRELDNLFNARLDRSWSTDEQRAIAALMRLQAVVRAAELAQDVLDRARGNRFSPGDARDLEQAFDAARQWSGSTDDSLEREDAAQQVLADAMLAVSTERWSAAVTQLERLLGEHADSLLVSLLSDGSAWRLKAPEPQSTPPPAPEEPGLRAAPDTRGLLGEYFSSEDGWGTFGTPQLTRVDRQIYFDWGAGSPTPLLPADGYAVRWTGTLTAVKGAGTYSLHVRCDDGVRLWLGGELLLDEWRQANSGEYDLEVELGEGESRDLRVDYFEAEGVAILELRWTPPGGTKAVIPPVALTPAPATAPGSGAGPDSSGGDEPGDGPPPPALPPAGGDGQRTLRSSGRGR